MANALWDRFFEVATPRVETPAIWHGDRLWSYGDLLDAAHNRAGWLASNFALAPGDRVVLAVEPCPEVLAWCLAVWHRGAIPTLTYHDSPATHLAHTAKVAEPRLVVGDQLSWPAGLACVALDSPETTDKTADLTPANRAADAPGSIIFTSGSTGQPKGVMQLGATLIDGAARVARHLGYQREDRILCTIPFAFDYGWGHALSCMLQGVPLVLPTPRNSFGLCAAIAHHRPTILAGVPAIFADLTSGLAPIRDTDRSSIRLITNTGSRIPDRTWEAMLTLFPKAQISLNYGLTETYRSASLPVEQARATPDAVGLPLPGVSLMIVREDGTEAAPEEEGEIVHRGAGTFHGYWNDPDKTAEALRADPLNPDGPRVVFTGDLGRIGDDGFLRVHGRRDRQLKSMGVRVSPDEIEDLLLRSDLLADAAVVAERHDVLGDKIVACIVPKASPSERDEKALLKELRAQARQTMSQFMQPRRWEIFDTLPRTSSNKVNYTALTQAVEARP